MFTPTITKEMLRELHRQVRERIEAAGSPTAYFASPDRIGYRLTTSGWQLVHGQTVTNNLLVAITDRDLYEQVATAVTAEACFDQILAEGVTYDKTSGDYCPLTLHGERSYDPAVPRLDEEPRVVCIDFGLSGPIHWADAHWFDLSEATPIGRIRLDCCEADPESGDNDPAMEVMLWRTSRGRWVAEIADPTAFCETLDPTQPAWGEINVRFAAHTIWCQRQVELTDEARDVPLVEAALAARGARDPGAFAYWGEAIRDEDLHCLARHSHHEEVTALRAMLIAVMGQEVDEVWREGGQALADWTWIEHGPFIPYRFEGVWNDASDDGDKTD